MTKNARLCGDKCVARRLPYIEYSFSSRLLLAVAACILCLIIMRFLFKDVFESFFMERSG